MRRVCCFKWAGGRLPSSGRCDDESARMTECRWPGQTFFFFKFDREPIFRLADNTAVVVVVVRIDICLFSCCFMPVMSSSSASPFGGARPIRCGKIYTRHWKQSCQARNALCSPLKRQGALSDPNQLSERKKLLVHLGALVLHDLHKAPF